MSGEPIALIGLDYYETIARITPRMRSTVFDQIGREAGLALPDGTLFRRWRNLARASWPLNGPRPPFRTMRETWTELGERLLERFGVRGGGTLVADLNSQLHAAARPAPADLAHLGRLAARYPLVLLSDADAEHLLPSLERCGLPLAQVLFSEKLRNYKPHIEMFRSMTRGAGVPPHRVLHVGDNPRTDILGARNAGMFTAWINRTAAPWPSSLPPPDLELRELADLDVARCPPR
jgi:FMN phosphatase YigB (HAD superfamily)